MEMYPPKATAPPYPQQPTAQYPQEGVPFYPHGEIPTGIPAYPPAYPSAYQQPFPGQAHGGSPPAEWSTGLCSCCDDPTNCLITACCPCVTAGQIAEIMDRGTTSCPIGSIIYTAILVVLGCPCIYSCGFRTKLRSVYAIKEDPCGDCCVHCLCECCALCQEYRELKIRGADPSIGWQLNVEKWSREGSTMPPAVASGMYR